MLWLVNNEGYACRNSDHFWHRARAPHALPPVPQLRKDEADQPSPWNQELGMANGPGHCIFTPGGKSQVTPQIGDGGASHEECAKVSQLYHYRDRKLRVDSVPCYYKHRHSKTHGPFSSIYVYSKYRRLYPFKPTYIDEGYTV